MKDLKEKFITILKTKHARGSIHYEFDPKTRMEKAVMRKPGTELSDEEVAQLLIDEIMEFGKQ